MNYPEKGPRETPPLTEAERATLLDGYQPEQAIVDMDYALSVLRDNEAFLRDAQALPGSPMVVASSERQLTMLRRVRARLERQQERDREKQRAKEQV